MLELKSWLSNWRAIPILHDYPPYHQSKTLLDGNTVLQPLHKSAGITSIREVKIQTVGLWFDIGSLAMHLCLDDLLLKEIEGTLMLHLLNDLSITNEHTFWRSWTTALQECSIDSIIQSSHVLASIIKHTMKDCWRTTPNASFWTVMFTLIRREWGSVHTNSASTNFTCFKPMDHWHLIQPNPWSSSNRKPATPYSQEELLSMEVSKIYMDYFSLLSTYLPQPLHWKTTICLGIPSVISTFERMQLIHMLALFGWIGVEQTQHKVNG